MLDIFFLFQKGWKTIWKEKVLWFFCALILVQPVLELIFAPKNTGASPFWSLAKEAIFLSLMFTGYSGITHVLYHTTIGNRISFWTSFQAIKNSFRKVAILFFVFSFFLIIPFLCLTLTMSSKQFTPFSISRNLFLSSSLLSIFNAMLYFSLIEIIINDFGVRKSIKSAWGIFTKHFMHLIAIGIILMVASYIISVATAMTTILINFNFNIATLRKVDFVVPYLSFPDMKIYRLASVTGQTILNLYSISVFVLSYFKYSGFKENTKINNKVS